MTATGVPRFEYQTDLVANPAIEIAACQSWLRDNGFPVPPAAYRMLVQDFSQNPHHRSQDFIAVWAQAIASKFPMQKPVAIALDHAGGKPENATRVELRAQARIVRERQEEQARLRQPTASDPLDAMSQSGEFGALLSRLVRAWQSGRIPHAEYMRLTSCAPGSFFNGQATENHKAELRGVLAGVGA